MRVGNWKLHVPHKWRRVVTQGKDGQPGKQDSPKIDLSLYNLKDDIGEKIISSSNTHRSLSMGNSQNLDLHIKQ